MIRAFLLLPRLDPYDAIANDVLGMADALETLGFAVEIIAAGGKLKQRFRKPGSGTWKHASDSDLLIYHYGIAWERGDELFQAFPGRKILRFHNVTPAEFYEPYHAGIANACREGLRRVALLRADKCWSVSRFNGETLRSIGWDGEIHELPPFHRIEETLELEIDTEKFRKQWKRRKKTETRIQGKTDSSQTGARSRIPVLLFVGRLVPNKSLPETIRTLDAQLGSNSDGIDSAILRIVGGHDPALAVHVSEIQEAARGCSNLVVELCGRLDQESLKREFLMADALVTFSRHEGFCVPVVEAMAMGLPVITMNSTAVRDTLGGCGFALRSPDEVASGAKRTESAGNEEARHKTETAEATESAGSILRALRDHSSILDEYIENGIRRYHSHFHPSALKSKLGALLENLGYEIPKESPVTVLPRRLHTPDKVSRESRIALIVVRFGEEFAGGSEKEAFDYANLLASSGHNVDVFTSCARNAESWRNEYESGLEEPTRISTNYSETVSGASGQIRVFRFPVSRERTGYWHRLDALLNDSDRLSWVSYSGYAFNLEWIRAQGPCCPDLLHELNRASDYHRYLYMTYLYYPTILGSMLTPSEKNYLVPTLHEERPANLKAMRRLPVRFRNLLWNTAEEGFLGHRLWNVTGGTVVGAPLELSGLQGVENSPIGSGDAPVPGSNRSNSSNASERIDTAMPTGDLESRAAPQETPGGRAEKRKRVDKPRFLYIGRWDSGKGTDVMLSLLKQYNSIRALELQIIGGGLPANLPRFANHMGFVSEETKLQLLENATALIVPSPMESFSIVTLEAMNCMTPVIVNGNNDVLRGHAVRSECALAYRDAAEFMQCLDRAIHGLDQATLEKGRAYASSFSATSILSRLKTGLQLNLTLAEPRGRETDPWT